jgi:hypothetical protein
MLPPAVASKLFNFAHMGNFVWGGSSRHNPGSCVSPKGPAYQAHGLGEESVPRDSPALKGHDQPLEAAEATFREGQRLVISPLQGLLPEEGWGLIRHPGRWPGLC